MKNIAKFDQKPEDIGFNIGGYKLGLQLKAAPNLQAYPFTILASRSVWEMDWLDGLMRSSHKENLQWKTIANHPDIRETSPKQILACLLRKILS
ncbi:MAG: hypothetical protein KAG99_03390 [Bacteroidales bacterium]|nr:hypothetical protein [Bacteroidales bacterium]